VTLGPADGEILISLKPEHRTPTPVYTRRLRDRLRANFPDARFFFQAANITNQILNFGLPAPIDVQVVGRDAPASYKIAKEIERRMALIPGAVDVHVHQEVNYPTVRVDVDRTKAEEVGLTQQNVANSVLISLSSSGQVAPNQWLNPENGVNYQLVAQTPQNQVDSFDALLRTPITLGAGSGGKTQLLSNLASVSRGVSTTVASHYNVQPVMDVYANVEQRDLGGVANQVERIMSDVSPQLYKGSWMVLRGQVQTMRSSFIGLGFGILFAIVLVYLLMAVNFQSWVDPFIILWALPGALAGIVWMLFVTQTSFSVPSLMGTIMCIGVATSNSILLVTFANDERLGGNDSSAAALSAGFTRIRPVIMTALAMIVGMLPMALGLGEGGEQNAPLGRAVIGGLLVATFTTLFFVPVMYSYLRKTPPLDLDAEIAREEREEGISLH
jgi:multidrug efflux pump subunit AcrB